MLRITDDKVFSMQYLTSHFYSRLRTNGECCISLDTSFGSTYGSDLYISRLQKALKHFQEK